MQDYGKWFKKTRFTNPKVPEFIDSGNTRTANRITRMGGTRLIQEYGPMYLKISEMLNRARIVPEKIVTYEEINEALNL